MENLKNIEKLISELPDMLSEDVEKIMDSIKFISSGNRNKYLQLEKLEKDLVVWGREFAKVLRDKYHISNKNTNYSSWEYGRFDFSVDIYYVLSRLKAKCKIEAEDDFVVVVSSWKTHNYEFLGYAKTPEEAIEILIKNKLFSLED